MLGINNWAMMPPMMWRLALGGYRNLLHLSLHLRPVPSSDAELLAILEGVALNGNLLSLDVSLTFPYRDSRGGQAYSCDVVLAFGRLLYLPKLRTVHLALPHSGHRWSEDGVRLLDLFGAQCHGYALHAQRALTEAQLDFRCNTAAIFVFFFS